jgi:putative heme-binding domain-containing protein
MPAQVAGGHAAAADADIDVAIAGLDAERDSERCAAQEAIERQGRGGTAAVRKAIHDGRLGVRGRLRAIWIVPNGARDEAIADLLERIALDPEPRVQAQAVRALADLTDPVLTRHRLDAGPGEGDGDAALAARLAALGQGKDPQVMLEVVIALGRLAWPDAPGWLERTLRNPDPALAHAAVQTLRRSRQWSAVVALLDRPDSAVIRGLALMALAERYEPEVVDGLIARLRVEPSAQRRREYSDLLTRVARQPRPWTYWGYRPPPRPANTVAWERTGAIEEALDRVLADPDRALRLAILRRMQREQIATRLETLDSWLRSERDPAAVAALVESLGTHPADRTRSLLESIIGDREQTVANRQSALALWAGGLDDSSRDRLVALAGSLEDGPVLAALFRQIGRQRGLPATSLLVGKLRSVDPQLRVAAIETLAALGARDTGEPVRALLNDNDASVRRAAVEAVGQLGVGAAIPALLTLGRDADPALRSAGLEALRLLHEPRAVPLAAAALGVRETQLSALRCLEDLGGPEYLDGVVAVARANPPTEVLHSVVRLLTRWSRDEDRAASRRGDLERALAEVQGASGVLVQWQVVGPIAEDALAPILETIAAPGRALVPGPTEEVPSGWATQLATGIDSRFRVGPNAKSAVGTCWLAATDLVVPAATSVQFLGSSSGRLRVWLNGRVAYSRDEARPFTPDSDRFEGALTQGSNRLVVMIQPSSDAPADVHLHFRRKGSTAEHERLVQLALARAGNIERGRSLFFNTEKTACLKCHRLRDQGARIGPDLTGIGSRFPRAYLIESILEPSRAIAPSYETLAVALNDGRVHTGVRTAETETTLTLADSEGRAHVLAKAEIEAQRPQTASLMPEGLEKPLSAAEFVDLIAFLAGER